MDTGHREATEMWQFNAGALHPLRDTKDTIAQHVMNGTAKVNGSIPSATFKNGSFPRSMAVMDFNENAEPDTKPRDMSFSPMEYAGLMNMRYAMPDGVVRQIRPHTWSEGLGSAMVRKGKWKTSNAAATRNTPYPPTRRTGTSLQTLKGGRSNYGKNRGILATGPDDTFIISEFSSGRRPRKHTFLNKDVLQAVINVASKYFDGWYEPPNRLRLLKDNDVATILGAATDWAAPGALDTIADKSGYSRGALLAMIRALGSLVAAVKNSVENKGDDTTVNAAPKPDDDGGWFWGGR